MSLSGVAAILQQMAENAGRQQMYRGAVIGNTISQATQIPAQMIEDRRRQAVIDREQAQRETSLRYAGNEDARRQQDQDMQNAANSAAQKHRQIVNAGLVAAIGPDGDPKSFNGQAAFDAVSQLGEPSAITDVIKAHKELRGTPIAGKAGDVFFDPDTHQPIQGMSVPAALKTGTNDLALLAQNSNPFVATLADKALTRAGHPTEKPLTYGAPQPAMVEGKRTFIRTGSDGNVYDIHGVKIDAPVAPDMHPPAAGSVPDISNVKEFVAGMKDGTLPPQTPGRASKDYTAIMAEAHRQGYDLERAVSDWNATQKHLASLNSNQQLKLNQSINALPEMLDKVDALASQWKGGAFPPLNKANLIAAKNGAYGKDVASVATQLDAQISDVNADLGVVYMGGNSPTDKALGLAGKSLAGEWDEKVLHDMVKLAKSNVGIRHNSIVNTGVAGASENNQYAPPKTQQEPGAKPTAADLIKKYGG